jgi:YVTN family beta-propeller protein
VVNTTTDKIVHSIGAGYWVADVAYDVLNGDIYATNVASGNVTVIDGTNGSIMSSTMVGSSPWGVAVDSSNGNVYVANSGSDNVSVIDGKSNHVIGAIPVGSEPVFPAFDPATNLIYVPNQQSDNVSVINGSTDRVVGTVRVGGPGTNPISVTVGGMNGCVYVGDLGSSSVSVLAPPIQVAMTVSATTVETGEVSMFGAHATGGLPSGDPRRYTWRFGDGASSVGTNSSAAHAYSATGTFVIEVTVTDAGGYTASANLSIIVNPGPIVASLHASRGSADVGQSVTFTASASQGTGTYLTYTWSGLAGGCLGLTTASVTCTFPTAGRHTINVTVMDSTGGTSPPSASLAFEVYADPTVELDVSPPTVDIGQNVTFLANGSLGSGGYAYEWAGLPAGCSGSSVVTCSPGRPGAYSIKVDLTDSNTFSVTSAPLSFTVYGDPAVQLSANRIELDRGQSLTFTAEAELGSGGYSYGWLGLPVGCGGTSAIVSCSPITSATFHVSVLLSDSNNLSVMSNAVVVVVNLPLSSSFTLAPTSPLSGGSVSFTATASGGTSPLAYTWIFGDGPRAATGSRVAHTYGSGGTYTVTLWVTDSAGASSQSSVVVSVGNTFLGLPAAEGYAVLGSVITAIAVVATIAVLLTRRRRVPPTPAERPASPPAPP